VDGIQSIGRGDQLEEDGQFFHLTEGKKEMKAVDVGFMIGIEN
jgi:hypothetical protein